MREFHRGTYRQWHRITPKNRTYRSRISYAAISWKNQRICFPRAYQSWSRQHIHVQEAARLSFEDLRCCFIRPIFATPHLFNALGECWHEPFQSAISSRSREHSHDTAVHPSCAYGRSGEITRGALGVRSKAQCNDRDFILHRAG